jgi:hypothetical protein
MDLTISSRLPGASEPMIDITIKDLNKYSCFITNDDDDDDKDDSDRHISKCLIIFIINLVIFVIVSLASGTS